MLKRVFDVALASVLLLILSPLCVILALLVKLDTSGPAFFRGVRVGRYGVRFRIYKFRTMVVNAERLGGFSTAEDDPRITRIGRRLRKYKLDELPQLMNVLTGEMSLVGPRPEVPHYANMYSDEERAILTVRPGLTDWASIWNPDEGAILAGNPDPEKTYMEKIRPEKLRLQLKYVREHSFRNDIVILFLTVRALVTPRLAKARNQHVGRTA